MKRFMLMLAAVLCFAVSSATVQVSASMPSSAGTATGGVFADGIEWSLDIQGTITITGNGIIPGYGDLEDVPWSKYREDIKAVVIGEGITSIGRYAFAACPNLTQVTLPSTLKEAQGLAFTMSGNLCRANITDMKMWAQLGFVWDASDPVEEAPPSKQLYLNGELVTEAVIPDGTEYIAAWSFRYCPDITSVTIGEGVESIGMFAFAECYNLQSVSLPSTLTYIDSAAFSECPIDTVELADISTWMKTEFGNTTANPLLASETGKTLKLNGSEVTELVIPQGFTEIPADIFAWCIKIKSLVIPEGVKTIGDRAFYICPSIEDITVPTSLEKVEEEAFYACDSVKNVYIEDLKAWLDIDMTAKNSTVMWGAGEKTLWLNGEKITKLVIPEGTTHIRADAFSHCSKITQLVLPSTVEQIGDRAFGWCYGLTETAFLGDPPVLGEGVFYACGDIFYYPSNNAKWKNFDKSSLGYQIKLIESVPVAFTGQPADITAAAGDNVTFAVKVAGDTPWIHHLRVKGAYHTDPEDTKWTIQKDATDPHETKIILKKKR